MNRLSQHVPAWQRLLAAAALIAVLVLVVQTLAWTVAAAVIGGVAGVEPDALLPTGSGARAMSAGAILALLLSELALIGGVVLAITQLPVLSWRVSGLRLAGTARALQLTAPLLAFIVGLPLLGQLLEGEPIVRPDLELQRILLFVVLSFAIGVAEELLFRGAVVELLGGAARPVLVIAGSAALFGIPHLGNGGFVNPIAVTLAVGVPFAVVRLAGGSVLGLAVVHGLIDIYALLNLGTVALPTDIPLAEKAMAIGGSALFAGAYVIWFWRRSQGPAGADRRSAFD